MADSSVDDDDASPKLCAHPERVGRLVRMCPIPARTWAGLLILTLILIPLSFPSPFSFSSPSPTQLPIPTKILILIPSDEKAIPHKGFTGA